METALTICRAVDRVAKINSEDRELMRQLRRWSYENRPASRFYYQNSAEIARRMTDGGVNWAEFVGFERAILTLLRAGSKEAAYQLYRDTIVELVRTYWVDCNVQLWKEYNSEYQRQEVKAQTTLPQTP